MKRWLVYTPEYWRSSENWWEPPECGPDVIEIEAETERDALALGVKAMLADHSHFGWCRNQRYDYASPYARVKAERVGEP